MAPFVLDNTQTVELSAADTHFNYQGEIHMNLRETTFGSITLTSTLAVITAAGIFYAPSLIWNTITMVHFI